MADCGICGSITTKKRSAGWGRPFLYKVNEGTRK